MIERKVTEDNVLTYTLRAYFGNLRESGAINKVNDELQKDNPLGFIKDFTQALANSFEWICEFFRKEKEDIALHAVYNITDVGVLMPFVIKAYKNDISDGDFQRMCKALESLYVRQSVIGTKAELVRRINDIYKNFDGNVEPLVERVDEMKTTNDYPLGYWSNDEFARCLQGYIEHGVAKKLLWRYENYLISRGRAGYAPIRYEAVKDPDLEHIAPQTENPGSGYFPYEDDVESYVECIGNYLLLNGSHNRSIGNGPFDQKRESYRQLLQQQEVRDMTEADHVWDKEKILARKKKIIDFLLSTY